MLAEDSDVFVVKLFLSFQRVVVATMPCSGVILVPWLSPACSEFLRSMDLRRNQAGMAGP